MSANHWFVLAPDLAWQKQTELSGEGICPASGRSLFKSKTGLGTSNHLVVNDDVDVGNLKEVVCAFATRNYPGASGELTFHDETTSPLVSFLYHSEKM